MTWPIVGRKRNLTADFIKGILIFCVLYGHSVSMINGLRGVSWVDSPVNIFVTAFEMPLFILVSGYFLHSSLQRSTPIKVLCKRVIAIAIPLLFWEGIPAAYRFVCDTIEVGFSLKNLLKIPYHCLFPGRLWFLGTYLYCSVIVLIAEWICSKMPKLQRYIRIVGYGSLIILIQLVPYSILNLQSMLPFFVVGFLLAKYSVMTKIKPIYTWILAGLFLVLYPFYKPEHSFYLMPFVSLQAIDSQLLIAAYRMVLGLCGCAGIYAVARMLCTRFAEGKVLRFMGRLGQITMELYITSMYIQELLQTGFGLVLKDPAWITDITAPLLWGPVFLIVMTSICYFIDTVSRKVKWLHKLLFGR